MLEKLCLKEYPDENLFMEFILQIPPERADTVLVRFTTYKMGERLKAQRKKGFTGWNTPQVENSDLLSRLKSNLEKGDYVDVINLAAMLLARENLFTEKHLGNNKS